jgi:hypothetical protein
VNVDQRRCRAVGQRADDSRLVGHKLIEDVVEQLELAAARAVVEGPVEQTAHLGAE